MALPWVTVLSVVAGAAPAKQPAWSPGSAYVAKGVCPGECCTYREWSARLPADVVSEVGGKTVVARLKKDERFGAQTGEVHSTAARATVTREKAMENPVKGSPKKTVKPGAAVWLLSPRGEGYFDVWIDGFLYLEQVLFVDPQFCTQHPDDRACWATVDAGHTPGKHRWWVKVKTKAGVVGWVDNTDDVLTGYDACG